LLLENHAVTINLVRLEFYRTMNMNVNIFMIWEWSIKDSVIRLMIIHCLLLTGVGW